MNITLPTFLQGLSIAVFGGWAACSLARMCFAKCFCLPAGDDDVDLTESGNGIGLFERVCFAVMIGFGVSGIGALLGVWIAVKAGISGAFSANTKFQRALASQGLIMSLISLTVAVIAGAVMAGHVTWKGASVIASILPLVCLVIGVIAATANETAAAAAES